LPKVKKTAVPYSDFDELRRKEEVRASRRQKKNTHEGKAQKLDLHLAGHTKRKKKGQSPPATFGAGEVQAKKGEANAERIRNMGKGGEHKNPNTLVSKTTKVWMP